jgi:hypothetical protein
MFPAHEATGNFAHVSGRKLFIPVQIYDRQHVSSLTMVVYAPRVGNQRQLTDRYFSLATGK